MAMYVEMFRTIVSYRYKIGYLHYNEFRNLRRQVRLLDYELKKMESLYKGKKMR